MRVFRTALVSLLTLSATLAGMTGATAAPRAITKYVALGDSYTVGVGTKTYDDPNDPCRRGPLSYSRLWATAHPSVSFVEASCSGDTTAEMMANQVPKITADTSLVTVQVGGNDAGFVDVLSTCILTTPDQKCVDRVNQAKALVQSTISGEIAKVYAAVRAAAPSAQVVVVGYPLFYKIRGNCGILGLSDTERSAINDGINLMDDTLAARAAEAGFQYLDARTAFAGHEICSGNPEWLTNLQFDKLNESYHPNTSGHRDGYFAALTGIAG